MKKIKKKIYLDYAATTSVDPRVFKKMIPYFSQHFGNTMSLHQLGQEAKVALEESRKIMANFIGAKSNEIIFTSSASESNNFVLKGIAFANKEKGRHIIISQIEHPCIMESAKWLEKQGFEITRLPVNKYGLVDPKRVERTIKQGTILVSIIHASNEIGTIEPVEEIGKIIKSKKLTLKSPIYFHTDASQSFGKIPINVNKLNVDLLTASSHKIYGPKGAGLLFVKEGTKIEPLLHGGGQEMGWRASTINLPAIVGFAEAIKIAQKVMEKEGKRLKKLKEKLTKGILSKIPGSYFNGHPEKSLANILNFWFEGVEGESIVVQLDLLGIAASTGSACSSAKLEPSHILLAIGLKPWQAHGSLRLSLGRWTREKDIDYTLKVLPEVIKKLRKISPFKKIIKNY